MAAGGPVQDLLKEATCPLCKDYFQDPVLIPECGHNFCRSCLTRSWGESPSEASCPQCRRTFVPGNILANRQLVNVVEIARRCDPRGEEGGSFCGTHREPLKLFCQDDETLICVDCDQSREHRDHRVIPLEEALQEYQIKVGDCLKSQKEEKEKILTYRRETEQKVREMLDLIQKEKENTVAEFRELRRWLEEQKKLLLARTKKTKNEIVAIRHIGLAKVKEELSSLEDLIQEMEKKHQQPASKLLQDIGSVLEKYGEKKQFEILMIFPLELYWKIWDYRDISVFLKSIMKQFRDTLEVGLELQKANIILDPDTAHPCLTISKDHKSIKVREDLGDPSLPKNPERFENWQYVLGCQGFSTGRYFWEVTVGDKEVWAVGVVRKSVERKYWTDISPDAGIWEIQKVEGRYTASFSNESLDLPQNARRIRVSLNCEGGQVTFFDGQTAALLYRLSEAPFAGETLLPSFYLSEDACLTLSP